MDEREARAWVAAHFGVPRETMERLDNFSHFLREENDQQNLVSAASLGQIWGRHIADSAQLLLWQSDPRATWLDLGSGAGFPGLIVAALRPGRVILVEARKLRAAFLSRAAQLLDVEVEIVENRVERMTRQPYAVISARAFAPLGRLLKLGDRFSTEKTVWILPKGRNAQSELDAIESTWQGEFRLEPSQTDPDARIIVATGVSRRGARSRRA